MKPLSYTRLWLLVGAAVCFAGTSAQAAEWRLVDVAGSISIVAPGAAPAPARLNQIVPTGATVTTSAGARATLDNGAQHMVVGPNSRMTVAPDAGGFTRVIQDLGAVMFQVDKQKVPHFRVDTPLLAAIVKGTTFTVVVEPQADAVNVAEGLVEVRSNMNSSSVDVVAGASGAVQRDGSQSVQVTTPALAEGPAPAPVAVEAIDYQAATDGLVDAAPAVAAPAQAVLIQADNSGSRGDDNGAGLAGGSLAADAGGSDRGGALGVNNNAIILASLPTAGAKGDDSPGGGRPVVVDASIAMPGANAGEAAPARPDGNSNGGGNGNGASANPAANGASSNGNSGNGNGNSGNGNGNSDGGLIETVVTTVTDPITGDGSGNSGSGNSGSGNSGNGNSGGGLIETVVTTVTNPITGNGNDNSGGGNSGNGNSGSGNSGGGNSGGGNSGNSGSGGGGLTGLVTGLTGHLGL